MTGGGHTVLICGRTWLGISLIVLRLNTPYTPKHQDLLSFRPRRSNRTGYISKTQKIAILDPHTVGGCAVQLPVLPSALNLNHADYMNTVT